MFSCVQRVRGAAQRGQSDGGSALAADRDAVHPRHPQAQRSAFWVRLRRGHQEPCHLCKKSLKTWSLNMEMSAACSSNDNSEMRSSWMLKSWFQLHKTWCLEASVELKWPVCWFFSWLKIIYKELQINPELNLQFEVNLDLLFWTFSDDILGGTNIIIKKLKTFK